MAADLVLPGSSVPESGVLWQQADLSLFWYTRPKNNSRFHFTTNNALADLNVLPAYLSISIIRLTCVYSSTTVLPLWFTPCHPCTCSGCPACWQCIFVVIPFLSRILSGSPACGFWTSPHFMCSCLCLLLLLSGQKFFQGLRQPVSCQHRVAVH